MRSGLLTSALAALLLLGATAAVDATAAPSATAPATTATAVRTCDPTPAKGHYTCYAMRRTDIATRTAKQVRAQAVAPDGYSPADLHSAYALPALTAPNGTGQRVYVVDAFNDPTIASDLATYRSQYGLPPCTIAGGCFQVLNQNGRTSPLPPIDPDTTYRGWASETALDVEMVSAVCPKCAITLISTNDATDNLFTGVATAVSLGAHFVSMSWGGPEVGTETDYDRQYFNARDVVFGAATGDDGYDTGSSYPSTSPNVLAVGGTSLTTAGTARGWSETAWDGAGSGCSTSAFPEVRPAFQTTAIVPATACTTRAESDVSADADPATGPAVYDTTGRADNTDPSTGTHVDNWTVIGGTSAATPIIVSTYALAGTPAPASSLVGQLYKNRAGLNDVVGGSNDTDPNNPCPTPTTRLCNAVAGWDGPTGLGTPNGLAAFTTTGNAPGTYLGAAPDRLLDTRVGTGAAKARLLAGRALRLKVTGVDGIPATGVEAVTLNVTVDQPAAKGYITAYADGATRPTASNLNFVAKQTVPNLVVVPVSAAGYVDLSTTATTDLIADAVGYYLPGAPSVPGAFVSLPPTRLLDTRVGTGGPIARVPAGTARHLQVEGAGGVPATGVSAVVLNVTVDRPASYGFITVYPGGPVPTTSSVNYLAGQTVPNLVVAPLDANGGVDLYSYATTDLIADVEGYYLAGTAVDAGAFTPVAPTRVLDTRNGTGAPAAGRIANGGYRDVVASARSAVPSTGVAAVVLNLTADQPLAKGYLIVFSDDDGSVPLTSSVNYVPGQNSANLTFAPVSTAGGVDVYASASTHVIADVSGYFRSP